MKQKTHFHGYSYFAIVPVFILGICLFGTQEIFAKDQFKVLTHNLYMLTPTPATPDWGSANRANKIADADYIKGYDVVMFDEVFHNKVVDPFLLKLKDKGYRYQTPVLNRSIEGWDASENFDNINIFRSGLSGQVDDGGVVIISKWLIDRKVQHYFTTKGCGADQFAAKGFVYARVIKNEKKYHIIATHVQAVDPGAAHGLLASCPKESEGFTLGATVRAKQFKEIADFIKREKIPPNEMVIIGGDMNVIKGTLEYNSMVSHLNVNEPTTYAGHSATWDPKNNALAAYNYPYPENAPEYLDYIFIEKDHAQPPHWTNLAMDIDFFPDNRWDAGGGYKSHEISDHYPVAAFISADDSTPKESNRRVKPYTHISLKSLHPGFENQYIFIDPKKGDDYLKVNTSETSEWTQFQFFKDSDPTSDCLRDKDKIQVMMQYHPGYYLERFTDPTSAKHSAYPYRKAPNANLYLIIVSGADDKGCMQNGTVIRLFDEYHLKPWKKGKGKWDGYLFFWDKKHSGTNHDFIVEMDKGAHIGSTWDK